MAIGYACKTIGVTDTDMRYCMLKDATEPKLMELIKHNISCLDRMIDYNIANNIRLFRISSDLIPFGSSSINSIRWWEHFCDELKLIGQKIKDSNMRVSMHPGQYTVLNSDKNDVVDKAIDDLKYHTRVLDSLLLDSGHKIILHIGGAYADKKLSAIRFMKNYEYLDESIKRRLVIENDDRIYNIREVLEIGTRCSIPVIFDNLHNELNPSDEEKDELTWIKECKNTWRKQDGNQKIHYSQQAKNKKPGSHSNFIGIDSFLDFYGRVGRDDLDIMLEVKDKNMSCVKCINCTADSLSFDILEKDWNRYKYTILERDPSMYHKISKSFSQKNDNVFAVTFYKLLEQVLQREGDIASNTKAVLNVWEDISDEVTENEMKTFHRNLEKYQHQQLGLHVIKNQLKRLADKYKIDHLTGSYYFVL